MTTSTLIDKLCSDLAQSSVASSEVEFETVITRTKALLQRQGRIGNPYLSQFRDALDLQASERGLCMQKMIGILRALQQDLKDGFVNHSQVMPMSSPYQL
ncbi:MAG: hypothetical protein P4L53_24520 [Candidatus Obscuribacterales bacterium]|nr:hypothetical protein [Candidatus Obscuribacterales bacterium]